MIACVHDFGIIDDFTSRKNYEDYTPEKYHCISVDDDIISSLNQNLSIMKTYFHTVKNQECGLVYYGITIIPPESLAIFYETVTSSKFFKSSDELNELALKIVQATTEQKYMIHYGV
ncbi:short-chain dehydrogenase [Bacillus pacificus]|nr:short-chain dehydrogenase [Bacillus pacificus]